MNHSESPQNKILTHDSNISIASDSFQDKTKFLSSVSECSSLITQALDPLSFLAFCPLTSSQAVFLVLSHHWHFSKCLPFPPSVCLHLFLFLQCSSSSTLTSWSLCFMTWHMWLVHEALPKSRCDFDALPSQTSNRPSVGHRLVKSGGSCTKYKSLEVIRDGVLFVI